MISHMSGLRDTMAAFFVAMARAVAAWAQSRLVAAGARQPCTGVGVGALTLQRWSCCWSAVIGEPGSQQILLFVMLVSVPSSQAVRGYVTALIVSDYAS